jgi:hypothetical protein
MLTAATKQQEHLFGRSSFDLELVVMVREPLAEQLCNCTNLIVLDWELDALKQVAERLIHIVSHLQIVLDDGAPSMHEHVISPSQPLNVVLCVSPLQQLQCSLKRQARIDGVVNCSPGLNSAQPV